MNLIEELFRAQEQHGNLGDSVLRELSSRLNVPLYRFEELRSFYPAFREHPAPRIDVEVCRDLSCHLNGATELLVQATTAASRRDDAGVRGVSCLGLCDRAPACRVNEEVADPGDVLTALETGDILEPVPPVPIPLTLDPHPAEGPYAELRRWLDPQSSEALLSRLEASGLRGMGGAGFPTGRKWRLVRDVPAPTKYIVCNADESEPGTFKDRAILENAPQLVVEGMALAAIATGAESGIIYLRHEYRDALRALESAIETAYRDGVLGDSMLGSGRRFDLRIFESAGGYVLGEETALLEALEGRRGEPRNKPPFPGTHGLFGAPTLINNVETLALVPRALAIGESGAKLFAVSGDVVRPGVVEAALGITARELIDRCGGVRDGAAVAAFLPGGASTRFLPPSNLDTPLDWTTLADAGSSLGSGALIVLAEGTDLLGAARNVTEFFRNESCGKCVPCRLGTQVAVTLVDEAPNDLSARIAELHDVLRDTSICGLGQAALNPLSSLLELYPGLLPTEART